MMESEGEHPKKWEDMTDEEQWAAYCARRKAQELVQGHALTQAEQAEINRKVRKSSAEYWGRLKGKPKTIFEQALEARVAEKPPIRLVNCREHAYEYLLTAYMRRVTADHKAYIHDPTAEEIIKSVAAWMVGGKKHGLLLRGGCGIGKSTLMRAVTDVFAVCDGRKTCWVSASQIESAGIGDKAQFSKWCADPMLAIDDMGVEQPTALHYGNSVSPMAELITERHKRLLFTLITTNLVETADGVEQIAERYGDRVFDRIRELCGIIKYSGQLKSYR